MVFPVYSDEAYAAEVLSHGPAPYHMISALHQSVAGLRQDLSKLKDASSEIEALKFMQLQDREAIVNLHQQTMRDARQIRTLSTLVIKLEDDLRIKKDKETAIAAKSWKKFMKVKGYDPEKNPDHAETIQKFFRELLKIENVDIPLSKSYWQGKWIVFELLNIADRGVIFQHVKHLKDVKAQLGKRYQVEDHLPEELKENKQRDKQIKYLNKLQPHGLRADITHKKGKLLVNNNPHQRIIRVVNARVLLSLDDDDYQRLETAHISNTGNQTEEDSHFKCYAAEVMNINQVVDNYKHLKIKHADATHISMAYRLPGENVAELQDYFDDSDYGIGRTILNVLVDEQKFYRAIYIVRHFGKKQLGSKRFDVAKQLAQQASRSIDSSEMIGEISHLNYPSNVLPEQYLCEPHTLARKEIHRSRWSIPESIETASLTGDEEVDFNSQKLRDRLDKLRNVPYQAEDWSKSVTGQWGDQSTLEAGDTTVMQNKL